MLSLVFTTLIGVNTAYVYFSGPLTWEEAKASCIAKGSNLAVILDDVHRALALAEIGGREAPYIGLEDDGSTAHPNGNPGHGSFIYPTQPEACPLDDGECVDFWINEDGKHHKRTNLSLFFVSFVNFLYRDINNPLTTCTANL
eukprot:659321_1